MTGRWKLLEDAERARHQAKVERLTEALREAALPGDGDWEEAGGRVDAPR